MSTPEEIRYDGQQEDREEQLLMPPEDCSSCGQGGLWKFRSRYLYGDDADGNRGMPMETWECVCGAEIEVTG